MKNIYQWYKFSNSLYKKKIPVFPQAIKFLIRLLFAAVIPYTAEIGEGTKFGYGGLAIVIHANCKIGKNCTISQGVTLGGTNHKGLVPVLGDNVFIGAGAKILGPITIGNNVVIGANAVVVKDIPANSLAVGIPAKVVKNDININDYI